MKNLLEKIFNEYLISAVIHLAASSDIAESILDPLKYYLNNTVNSRTLINTCLRYKIHQFIFSSSAATYGIPQQIPVGEDAVEIPINPYGRSKLMTEWILEDGAKTNPLNYVSLRYFNVAGADPQNRVGEIAKNAKHLIKVAAQAVIGLKESISIYGTDYPTPDGTCVRDYIHVSDLADVHVKTLDYLMEGGKSLIMNCGYGQGYSVKEILAVVKKTIGFLNIKLEERRPGDPPTLIADTKKIKQILHCQPRFNDIEVIINSAVEWERKWITMN